MTKSEILDYFKDLNLVYNDCTWLDTLSSMLDELLEKQSQWVSVKNRLPERDGCYLAYKHCFWGWNCGQITVCYWDGKNWFDHYIDTEEYKLSEDTVSHWMPLPEPPKEAKQGEN